MKDYYFEKEKLAIAEEGLEVFQFKSMGKQVTAVSHLHSSIEILFFTKGHFCVNMDGRSFNAAAGDMTLFRSNTLHSVYALDDGHNEYYVLKVKLSLILEIASKEMRSHYLLSLTSKNKNAKALWNREECEQIGTTLTLKRLIEEKQESKYGSDIAVKLCAVNILLEILRDTKNSTVIINESTDLIRRIYDTTLYINEHYAEDITATELCRRASLSYNYFSNIFKKVTELTFKDYLNLTRINHAERELLSSDKSITDIAASCGFNNTSYFIATFKKIKNITPSELRKVQKQTMSQYPS